MSSILIGDISIRINNAFQIYIYNKTMFIQTINNNIALLTYAPEIFLSCTVLYQLVANARFVNNLSLKFPIITKEGADQTITILLGTAYLYFSILALLVESSIISSMFCGTYLLKFLFILLAALVIYVAKPALSMQKLNNWEYFSIYLISVISLLLMISVDSLCAFYLVMEMQALCFYILASMDKESIFSAEAGLKYFISGSIISGVFLLGVSFIYGGLGVVDLSAILSLLVNFDTSLYSLHFVCVLIGVFLVIATLLFKLACAPFHFWAPDVYEGSPLSSTVIFSVLPKLSIVSFFFRFLDTFQVYSIELGLLIVYCGVLSAIFGSFYALKQTKIKKLLIYGSISQTGFLVAGLGAFTLNSKIVVLVFLIIYLLTTLVLWELITRFYLSISLVANFRKLSFYPLYITDFSNLGKYNFIYALILTLICFSLAGIPFLTGFIGKMSIFEELIRSSFFIPAVLLSFISAVSVFYYIRMIKLFFFDSKKYVDIHPAFVTFSNQEDTGVKDFLLCCVLAFLTFCFFYCEPLYLLAHYVVDFWFK